MKVTHYLLGYDNLKIIQDPDMFNFSIDSVLLPNFATINTKTKKNTRYRLWQCSNPSNFISKNECPNNRR